MAEKLNWLEWQGKKLVQKRPVEGTKCVKETNNGNNGREPWSSGYGSKLTFQRSWVRTPAPDTGWT